MRFKQQANALIIILFLITIMTESILTILMSLRDQQIAIRAWGIGVLDKTEMVEALTQLEHHVLMRSGRMHYKNHQYDYSIAMPSDLLQRITIREGAGLCMQSTVISGVRQSWTSQC